MSMWYAISNMMGHGEHYHPVTAAGRVLAIGLYIVSLILVATYTANLASDLTTSKAKNIISGIDDIKNGKIPYHRIGICVGTTSEDYYLREISGGRRTFYPLASRQELYDSLLHGIIDASFMDIGVAEYVTNNIYCNLTLVGSDFDRNTFGIVFSKEWLYGKDLDLSILSLRESGALDDLKKKWFQMNNCPDTSETSNGMRIEDMSGLFLTFAIISVLSLTLFAWKKRSMIKDCLWRRLCRQKLVIQPHSPMVKSSQDVLSTVVKI
ncbi:unnamed protein product [Rotaria sp. Silwood2]|nr:unnamed protein product [Rotaria sp. Silwood2]CAF3009431.1 unnamed protein product [Rotaria sp. Silwood2]CAF4164996.1 unnamed protein product [Rotaria sp. Silwood2]CAF4192727.1 unnamed protein product [Rotaria sp. Silwood2]